MTPPSRAMWEASPTPMFGVRDPSHSSFAAQASVDQFQIDGSCFFVGYPME